MDFVIDFEGRVGLREKGKWWKVIDNHTCFLADKKIETLFRVIRSWVQTAGITYFDRKANTGLLRYAVLRTSTVGESLVNIITSAPADPLEETRLLDALRTLSTQIPQTSIVWTTNHTISDVSFGDTMQAISHDPWIEENIEGFQYRVAAQAFFQTNPHAAALLLQTVQAFAGAVEGKNVLDLYCGSGFFSIPLAKAGAHITGVELGEDAIRDAHINAERNTISADFHVAKVEDIDWIVWKPDILILDPPRMGMHDRALETILQHAPPHIVYISCNYKNFARELVRLQDLYRVENMRAIDMFPHTPHVELVTSLIRR